MTLPFKLVRNTKYNEVKLDPGFKACAFWNSLAGKKILLYRFIDEFTRASFTALVLCEKAIWAYTKYGFLKNYIMLA